MHNAIRFGIFGTYTSGSSAAFRVRLGRPEKRDVGTISRNIRQRVRPRQGSRSARRCAPDEDVAPASRNRRRHVASTFVAADDGIPLVWPQRLGRPVIELSHATRHCIPVHVRFTFCALPKPVSPSPIIELSPRGRCLFLDRQLYLAIRPASASEPRPERQTAHEANFEARLLNSLDDIAS